jgi:ABC-type uncharacterized transport system auxiliary subunit
VKATHSMVTALLLATTACGCSLFRAQPLVRYYTLTLSGTPATQLEAPVTVGGFTADEPYATARMAYRSSPYRLDYYTYHRWAADPRNMVRTAIRDYFEHATAGSGTPFEIEGNIRRLEEVDDPAGWLGALALDIKVTRGGTIVLEHAYSETEPAEARNAEAVAAALSRALRRVLDQVAADLARSGPLAPPRAGR